MLHRRLGVAGVKLMFHTELRSIGDNSAVVSTDGQERRLEPIDQVIIAVGVTPRSDLKDFLKNKAIRHFIVGDADQPRRIMEATEQGANAAWQI